MKQRFIILISFLTLIISGLFGDDLQLTEQEKTWLEEHPVIRLGVGTSFPPIQYVEEENGGYRFQGIASDYVDILSERLGIEMEIVYGITFQEALEFGKNKEIDLFPCLAYSEGRDAFLEFTEGYLENPIVIFSNDQAPFIGTIQDLSGLRVADIEALYIHEQLRKDVDGIEFEYADDVEEGLELVAFGKSDASVTGLVSGSYLIRKNNWTNVKIAAPTPYPNTVFRMGVRDDWPELVSIIDKVLSSISTEEKNEINRKWIAVRYEYGINPQTVTRRILLIGAAAIIIIGIVLLWVIRLRREISQRKKAEQSLSESEGELRILLKEKEILLREVYHRVKNNLALVKSLISLQASSLSSPEDRERFKYVGARLDSMVLLHEKLALSSNFTEINFKEYLEGLVEELKKINADTTADLDFRFGSPDISFDTKTLIPLGLIITELVTNAIKHGFPQGRTGFVEIRLKETSGGGYFLSVKNNGVPMEASFDPMQSESLGMQLVTILTEQLNGELEFIRSPETEFRISF